MNGTLENDLASFHSSALPQATQTVGAEIVLKENGPKRDDGLVKSPTSSPSASHATRTASPTGIQRQTNLQGGGRCDGCKGSKADVYKLIDFGTAAGWGESGAEECMQTACQFAGTPAYSPPEAFRKDDNDGDGASCRTASICAWDQVQTI